MSVTCPRGHPSATTDYCDECGTRIEGRAHSRRRSRRRRDDEVEAASTEEIVKLTPPPDAERCPRCGAPRTGDDRFCEADGYDFVAPAHESHAEGWEAVVTADRAYYDAVAPDDVEFPDVYEPRTFPLDADAVLVGRRSESRGIVPTIDLAGSPEDNAISHRHAELIRGDDGSYVARRPRFHQRNVGQRRHRRHPARHAGAAPRRRSHLPRRLDHDHDPSRRELTLSQLASNV